MASDTFERLMEEIEAKFDNLESLNKLTGTQLEAIKLALEDKDSDGWTETTSEGILIS